MEVKELTTQEFKEKVMNYDEHPNEWVFEGDKPVIIDFYATWCGPCKATAPIVADIAKTYAGKIDVYKVDVDQQQELAARTKWKQNVSVDLGRSIRPSRLLRRRWRHHWV